MTERLSIRQYASDDRTRVDAVMEAALRDTGAYFEDVPHESTAPIEEEYLDSGGEFLVGEVDGEIVAIGAFRPVGGLVSEYLDSIDDGTVELKRIHVAPEQQRLGYGQQILDELQRRAHNRGSTTLVLLTTSLQKAAHRFYESNGFIEIDRTHVTAGEKSFDDIIYRTYL